MWAGTCMKNKMVWFFPNPKNCPFPGVNIFQLDLDYLSLSASELPKAKIGRRPICWLIPSGLPALSSKKLSFASRISTGLPSCISNLVTMELAELFYAMALIQALIFRYGNFLFLILLPDKLIGKHSLMALLS